MTIDSIRAEFGRYKTLAERAFAQLPDENLNGHMCAGTNSVSTLIRHLAGNLKSRYTDFMVEGVDGEKSWRPGQWNPPLLLTTGDLPSTK
jgi:Protein of unknown function (DUF1572)